MLNSRLMLYRFYNISGETQRRNFPYLTQKTVQDLPIRRIDFSDRRQAKLHDEIADRVAAILGTGKPPTDHEDYEIEKRVMQLYVRPEAELRAHGPRLRRPVGDYGRRPLRDAQRPG